MERVRKRRLMGEINVVPYIDVMLVLLIIFMVTAPMLSQGIKVDLPEAAAEPLDPAMQDSEPLILSVDAAGMLYLNVGDDEESPREASQILRLAQTVLKRKPDVPVLVKADQNVPYGRVVTGMVLLQRAGAQKVGFLVDPADFDIAELDAVESAAADTPPDDG
jgi:biopolymer transport protein TolR